MCVSLCCVWFIGRRRCEFVLCVVYWEEEVRVCEFVLCGLLGGGGPCVCVFVLCVVYWEEEVRVCLSLCVSVLCLLGGGGPCV